MMVVEVDHRPLIVRGRLNLADSARGRAARHARLLRLGLLLIQHMLLEGSVVQSHGREG